MFGSVWGDEDSVVDHNEIEFLSLEVLSDWLVTDLPEFDVDFINAAARIHKECFDDELFDYFAVEESDLFEELLYIKDEWDLKCSSCGV